MRPRYKKLLRRIEGQLNFGITKKLWKRQETPSGMDSFTSLSVTVHIQQSSLTTLHDTVKKRLLLS